GADDVGGRGAGTCAAGQCGRHLLRPPGCLWAPASTAVPGQGGGACRGGSPPFRPVRRRPWPTAVCAQRGGCAPIRVPRRRRYGGREAVRAEGGGLGFGRDTWPLDCR